MSSAENMELRQGLEILAKMIAEYIVTTQANSKNHNDLNLELEEVPEPERRLFTVKQWVTRHPCFHEGGIRQLIFNCKTNGFESVIRRVGRKVLIDEKEFFCWLDK